MIKYLIVLCLCINVWALTSVEEARAEYLVGDSKGSLVLYQIILKEDVLQLEEKDYQNLFTILIGTEDWPHLLKVSTRAIHQYPSNVDFNKMHQWANWKVDRIFDFTGIFNYGSFEYEGTDFERTLKTQQLGISLTWDQSYQIKLSRTTSQLALNPWYLVEDLWSEDYYAAARYMAGASGYEFWGSYKRGTSNMLHQNQVNSYHTGLIQNTRWLDWGFQVGMNQLDSTQTYQSIIDLGYQTSILDQGLYMGLRLNSAYYMNHQFSTDLFTGYKSHNWTWGIHYLLGPRAYLSLQEGQAWFNREETHSYSYGTEFSVNPWDELWIQVAWNFSQFDQTQLNGFSSSFIWNW